MNNTKDILYMLIYTHTYIHTNTHTYVGGEIRRFLEEKKTINEKQKDCDDNLWKGWLLATEYWERTFLL